MYNKKVAYATMYNNGSLERIDCDGKGYLVVRVTPTDRLKLDRASQEILKVACMDDDKPCMPVHAPLDASPPQRHNVEDAVVQSYFISGQWEEDLQGWTVRRLAQTFAAEMVQPMMKEAVGAGPS